MRVEGAEERRELWYCPESVLLSRVSLLLSPSPVLLGREPLAERNFQKRVWRKQEQPQWVTTHNTYDKNMHPWASTHICIIVALWKRHQKSGKKHSTAYGRKIS